jgi:hypothetical protein
VLRHVRHHFPPTGGVGWLESTLLEHLARQIDLADDQARSDLIHEVGPMILDLLRQLGGAQQTPQIWVIAQDAPALRRMRELNLEPAVLGRLLDTTADRVVAWTCGAEPVPDDVAPELARLLSMPVEDVIAGPAFWPPTPS